MASAPPSHPQPSSPASTQLRPSTRSVAEVGLPEAGLPEVGLPEAGPPEVGPPEVCFPEVGLPEVGPPEVGPPEVCFPLPERQRKTSGGTPERRKTKDQSHAGSCQPGSPAPR
ncbi:hypothetical protein NQZ68_032006 [Dissostichus eleginoides]|nr:hypothetical protein NQZ68_032006 [Dissostichus eleginoides]